jgi:hypothetical protein
MAFQVGILQKTAADARKVNRDLAVLGALKI